MASPVMNALPVPVIGLVGGVGSGKSSLARWLGRQRRVCLLDADDAGHRVLSQPDVQTAIRRRFGTEIFEGADVRRDRLAARVFGSDAGQIAARHDLENILHPVIRRELERELNEAVESGEFDVIVLDAPLLLEAGWQELCDSVVFVETPYETRLQRVQAGRGWDAAELRRREESQLSLEEKRRAADQVVDNSGDIDSAGVHLSVIVDGLIHQP